MEAALLASIMGLFACLPVDWASALGGYIGRIIASRTGMSRRALENLRRALPENSNSDNERIIKAMWDNLGRASAEYPHLGWICASQSDRVEVVNAAGLTGIATSGKPTIVFGGHFGNWEVGPLMIHNLVGDSLLSVYRAANNPLADRLLRRMRRARHSVPKGAEGGRALLRQLRRGGQIGILVDQKLNDGVAVPFFGRNAMTAPAIARFSLRFGCPLVPARLERLHGARFRLTVLPPLQVVDSGDAPHDVLAAMTRINAIIEDWIRAQPEQWLWIHKRWPD
jgi:KDO2-lipid IV(A) lauroyltransferase